MRPRQHDAVARTQCQRHLDPMMLLPRPVNPLDVTVTANPSRIHDAALDRLFANGLVQRPDVAIGVGQRNPRRSVPTRTLPLTASVVIGCGSCLNRIADHIGFQPNRILLDVMPDRWRDLLATTRQRLRRRTVPRITLTPHLAHHRQGAPLAHDGPFHRIPARKVRNRLQLLRIAHSDQLAAHRLNAVRQTRPLPGPHHAGLIHDEHETVLRQGLATRPARLPGRQRRRAHAFYTSQLRRRLA